MHGRLAREFFQDVWAGFFIVLTAIGLFTGHGLIVAFGVLGLLIVAISWLWNRLSLEDVTYQRHLDRNRAFVGEEVPITVALTNKKPIPLGWVRVDDRLPIDVEIIGGDGIEHPERNEQLLSHSTSMAWYERVKWEYRLKCHKRGLYRIGPARLESGDLFGFYSSVRTETQRDYLLIYPKVVPLRELGVPALRPLGEVRGGVRIYEDISRPSTVRDYRRGDPLKRVDWKLSARAQRLQVRSFDPSSTITVVLVVAVETTSSVTGGYSPELLERIVTAAASVASYVAERRYSLGLFSNSAAILEDRPTRLAPSRAPEQLNLVLEALATAQPVVVSPLPANLAEHARRFAMGATLVIVAAVVDPKLSEVILEIKERGHPVVVLYVGEGRCPQMPEGVVVHELSDYFKRMELADEFGPR